MRRLLPLLLLILASGCTTTFRAIKYNVPDITDYQIFKTERVSHGDDPFFFIKTDSSVTLPPVVNWVFSEQKKKKYRDLTPEEFFRKTQTTAFLVIRNDSILYERYFNGYGQSSEAQVFSVSKAIVSALTGIALKEGYIKSLDQPVSDFIPEFATDGRKSIKLRHLLQMTSGLDFGDFTTFTKLSELYYTDHQENLVKRIGMAQQPGTEFSYKSIATMILGMCLEKATGTDIAKYMEDKLWKPLGMEYDARWVLDRENGYAKMYGGVVARTRDLAKFGRLYLNNGQWNGQEIIPKEYVLASRTPDTTNGGFWGYSYCWWLDTYTEKGPFEKKDFFAAGFNGQNIYVAPEKNLIIVRQGKRRSHVSWPKSISRLAYFPDEELDYKIDEALKNEYRGNYADAEGNVIRVGVKNNELHINRLRGKRVELDKISKINFENRKKEVGLIFNMENDKVEGIYFDHQHHTKYYIKL